MTDVVARFLFLCRPRGKALPKSYEAAIGIGSTIESNMNKLHGMVCYVGPSKEFQYFLRKSGSGVTINTEAWVLRRLITIFSQVARRPHIPRDPQMRRLFEAIGIKVEPVSEGP